MDTALGWRVVAGLLLVASAVLVCLLVGICSGIRLDPGDVFSDRSALLVNASDRVATLMSIRRLGTVGTLRQGRIYVALGTSVDPDGAVTGAGEGFPPKYYERKDLKDPQGFRVPPATSRAGRFGAVVMTIGRLRAGETFGMRGYEVTYRVGPAEYRTVVPQAVAACAARRERCDPGDLLDRMLAAAAAARDR